MLATKLRALYQRRKGRDLYDLYHALIFIPTLDCDLIIECFKKYVGGQTITRSDFLASMEAKLQDTLFRDSPAWA